MIERRSSGARRRHQPGSPVIAVTSPPAQNPRPAPVSTTTRTDGVVGEGAQRVAQRDDVLEVERVEPFGAIQGDGRDRAVVLDDDAQDALALRRLDEREDLLRAERRLRSLHAEWAQRVGDRVGDRRVRADGAALAHALVPAGVGGRLGLDVADLDRRDLRGGRRAGSP